MQSILDYLVKFYDDFCMTTRNSYQSYLTFYDYPRLYKTLYEIKESSTMGDPLRTVPTAKALTVDVIENRE